MLGAGKPVADDGKLRENNGVAACFRGAHGTEHGRRGLEWQHLAQLALQTGKCFASKPVQSASANEPNTARSLSGKLKAVSGTV